MMNLTLFAAMLPLFAAEYTPIQWSDFQAIITALQAQLSVSTVVGVLTQIVTICVGLAFMWWGVRKATRALMSAFKKGKIRI